MSRKTIKKLDKFWPSSKFSKCPNGKKGMYHLMRSGRESMTSLNGIHKLKLKSRISLRAVLTLMEVKLPPDSLMNWSKNFKFIKLNYLC